MKVITNKMLEEILNTHSLWLKDESSGERADLSGADLSKAYLSGADLRDAYLRDADLRDANDIYLPLACPEKGSFIGFKKLSNGKQIVELFIPTDAKRLSSTGRKCRCNKAKVISITNLDGSNCKSNKAKSSYDQSFIYTVGEYVEVKNFDDNRWNECAPGIHFFITREEAVRY